MANDKNKNEKTSNGEVDTNMNTDLDIIPVETEASKFLRDKIILRSSYSKSEQKYYIMPARDRETGLFPDCVKPVDSNGNLILKDSERNSDQIWIPENRVFVVVDGTSFDLNDKRQSAEWLAIQNCPIIAMSRDAKDSRGFYIIDGDSKRYGYAELYVECPGEEARKRVTRKETIHKAEEFIFKDSVDHRLMIARILGRDMSSAPDADVKDYLLTIAAKNPEKIISAYTGGDAKARIFFLEAKKKKVIKYKDKLYIYGDDIILGASEDAVVNYLKDPKNKKIVDLIYNETFNI